MKPKSLRGQLTRAAMLTVFVAMLLSAGALFTYELLTYRKAWVNDLQTQADLIARSSVAALVFNDPKVLRENLAPLKSQPEIRAAAVYGKDGALLAAYATTPEDLAMDRSSAVARGGARFSGSVLEVAYPIERDGERVGTLYLRAQHDIWPRLTSYAAILGAVFAGSLALAFAVFSELQNRVTTPLVKMTRIAQEVVSSRNWDLRAPDTDYHDVRVLVEAFNGMLSECGARTRELEREMATRQTAERELRLADRRKDEFLATLAHELRNPLAPMTTALALIEMPTAPAEAREKALGILGRQVKQMVRLIDDLLDASRIASGKLSLHKQSVDLCALLQSAVELAQPLAIQNGLKLSLELPRRALYIDGDAIRLAQIFSNLLNNACRYTPSGGRIDVVATQEKLFADVSFRDTGIGVEPDMQERIFDLFEQVDKTLQRGNAGLGIGLTLTRQLVQLHDGTVSMTSEGLGRGSCFTVRLPLLQAVNEGMPTNGGLAGGSKALRILLADDNLDATESLAELLRALGHDVIAVHDGEAALKAAAQHVPDIALLDIGMPRYNGYEVARLLRASAATRDIRLVAVTGWGQASDRENAKRAGFDHHLVKPVDPQELVKLLSEMFSA